VEKEVLKILLDMNGLGFGLQNHIKNMLAALQEEEEEEDFLIFPSPPNHIINGDLVLSIFRHHHHHRHHQSSALSLKMDDDSRCVSVSYSISGYYVVYL
jgi:hypothetical protein